MQGCGGQHQTCTLKIGKPIASDPEDGNAVDTK